MAGLTPFQFSSGKRQYEVLLGLKPTNTAAGILADSITDLIGWYEMWINPSTMNKQSKFKQTQQHTAGAIVNFFYRPEYTVMSCQGKVGWLRIHSVLEEAQSNAISNLLKGDLSLTDSQSGKSAITSAKEELNKVSTTPWNMKSSHSNRFNNSPLQFLKRLQGMALDPMYYIDNEGVEHYNPKYIKCFTQEYPDGVIYRGYFDNFVVDENVENGETIAYSFVFVIQSETPVTLVQRVLGAYAGFGSAVGDAASLASGLM